VSGGECKRGRGLPVGNQSKARTPEESRRSVRVGDGGGGARGAREDAARREVDSEVPVIGP
jgi:hypothetical protein